MWGRNSRHADLIPVVNSVTVSSQDDIDTEEAILNHYDLFLMNFIQMIHLYFLINLMKTLLILMSLERQHASLLVNQFALNNLSRKAAMVITIMNSIHNKLNRSLNSPIRVYVIHHHYVRFNFRKLKSGNFRMVGVLERHHI